MERRCKAKRARQCLTQSNPMNIFHRALRLTFYVNLTWMELIFLFLTPATCGLHCDCLAVSLGQRSPQAQGFAHKARDMKLFLLLRSITPARTAHETKTTAQFILLKSANGV
jgi:hypothetical protein